MTPEDYRTKEAKVVKQDRSVRTRQTILSAAARVFEERGYQMATISEILTAAGVTKGALYFHFPSKEDLARASSTRRTRCSPSRRAATRSRNSRTP